MKTNSSMIISKISGIFHKNDKKSKKEKVILRIPGGVNRFGNYSAFAIIFRSNKKLEIEVLVCTYRIRNWTSEKNVFKESRVGALTLKVLYQTGVDIYNPQLIGRKAVNDNSVSKYHKKSKKHKHLKEVYAVDRYDDSGIKTSISTESKVGVPEWIELSKLRKDIFPEHLWIVDIFENHLVNQMKVSPKK